MKQAPAKITYPKGRNGGKGRMLQVRECTVAICNNNNPGAVLLSTLLFWHDNPREFDRYEGNDFIMCRTQAEIEKQACNQIDVKTIHRTAVPFLQVYGYLTVIEKMNGNIYILHMDRIYAAYAAYENGDKQLLQFLKSSLQLDNCPISMDKAQLDKFLINRTNVQLQLDKCLIQNRQNSNCKRGRKPGCKVAAEAQNENTETIRDSLETGNKREIGVCAIASTPPLTSLSENDDLLAEDEPTEKRKVERPKKIIKPVITLPSKQPTSPPAQVSPPARFEAEPLQAAPGASDTPSQLSTSYPQQGDNDGLPGQCDPHPFVHDSDSKHHLAIGTAPNATRNTHRATPAQPEKVVQANGDVTQAKTVPKRRRAKVAVVETEQVPIEPEVQAVLDAWCSIFKVAPKIGPKSIEAAAYLIEPCRIWCAELDLSAKEFLIKLMKWAYSQDKKGYYGRGVKITDIPHEFEGWQSAQERPQPGVGNGRTKDVQTGYKVDYGDMDAILSGRPRYIPIGRA